MNTHRFCLIFILVLMTACRSLPVPADGDSQPVEHIIIVWLKESGNRDIQQRVIAKSQVLISIPGVLSLKSGTAIPSERPIVDSSFDLALIITFTDTAAMESYLTHPVHLQLLEETLKPLVERIQVYDFSN